MTERFSVKGSFAVLVDGQIDKPDGWDEMDESAKRHNIAQQLSENIYEDDREFIGFDASADVVTEVLDSAEEIFDESAE